MSKLQYAHNHTGDPEAKIDFWHPEMYNRFIAPVVTMALATFRGTVDILCEMWIQWAPGSGYFWHAALPRETWRHFQRRNGSWGLVKAFAPKPEAEKDGAL